MLAINAHGSAIPGAGETRLPGQTYGSLSNLIQALTAVVWNSGQSQYVLKTFQRSDPDIRPFLAHLGRAFITEVTLQVAANQNLRCQSWVNQAVADVFAPPSSAGPNSFASYVQASGRIEAIWFPFTGNPWLKIWSIAPSKPALSTKVTSPYNYAFTNSVTTAENTFFQQVATGDVAGTPAFEGSALALVDLGLVFDGVWDIWGQSQNTLLYVKPTTVRIVEAGYAIITSRASIQQVVSDFYAQYTSRLAHYQELGQFPMNGPVEIRVTGLDQPSDVAVSGAQSPILSSVRPRPDHPEWDTAVWLDGHDAGHGWLLPVLRGHGSLDLEPLQRQLRHGTAGVVQGLGVHRRRAMDRCDHSRQHHPGHGQRRSSRAASSRWLLTSSADARRVTQATRLDSQTSPMMRAMATSSAVGSPSWMACVSVRSISRATVLTSAAALGSANMKARVIASVSIGSRCMVLVIRPRTNSIRSYGVSPGIVARSSFCCVRSNSRTSADTSRWILDGKYR